MAKTKKTPQETTVSEKTTTLADQLRLELVSALEKAEAVPEGAENDGKRAAAEGVARRLRNVLADHHADEGRTEEAACQTFLVEKGHRPYLGVLPNAAWFNGPAVCKDLQDPESNLPGALYAKLTGGKVVANHRLYDTLLAAETDVEAAWLACVKEGQDPTASPEPEKKAE